MGSGGVGHTVATDANLAKIRQNCYIYQAKYFWKNENVYHTLEETNICSCNIKLFYLSDMISLGIRTIITQGNNRPLLLLTPNNCSNWSSVQSAKGDVVVLGVNKPLKPCDRLSRWETLMPTSIVFSAWQQFRIMFFWQKSKNSGINVSHLHMCFFERLGITGYVVFCTRSQHWTDWARESVKVSLAQWISNESFEVGCTRRWRNYDVVLQEQRFSRC